MILSLLLQFTVSFAQPETLRVERDVSNDVVYEIESKASRIARTARYSRATDANLAQALQLLENAELLLSGRNRSRLPDFKCTSRDSDNSAPYIIGVLDPSTRTLTKLNQTFSDMNECERFRQ